MKREREGEVHKRSWAHITLTARQRACSTLARHVFKYGHNPRLHPSVASGHASGASTVVSPRSYSTRSREEVYCKEEAGGESSGKWKREKTETVLHRVMYPKTHSNGLK